MAVGAPVRKYVSLLLFALFLHAVMLNGLTPPSFHAAAGTKGKAVLVTFDVCGHHAPANGVAHFDLTAGVQEGPAFTIHETSEFPPMPDAAAPSAEPGEVEHPPKA